jgi:hypothetical protein
MGLSGDTAALARWQRNINRLVGVPQRVAGVVAPIFQTEIRKGFDSKTDPYGGGWKDIKPKTFARGTKSILNRSGALMGSVGAMPLGTRLRILFGMPYAKYYITTGRGILPQAGRLPDSWKVTIKRESERAFTEIVGGQ